MNHELKIEYIPINQLKLSEYNPRKMTEKQAQDLTESMRRFGLVDPIVVNQYAGREHVIVGGHQRWKIAKSLGIDKVPCVFVNVDEAKEKELNLRLNRNLGEWDLDLLANFDVDLLKDVGWTDEELDEIFDFNMGENTEPYRR